MSVLNINFEDVPDKVPQIQPGIADLRIEEINIEDVADPQKPGKQKLVVVFKIETSGSADIGRTIKDHISLEMKTKLKNLYHSAMGERPGAGGFDPADLIGKVVKAELEANAWKNPAGKTIENTRVGNYLIPA